MLHTAHVAAYCVVSRYAQEVKHMVNACVSRTVCYGAVEVEACSTWAAAALCAARSEAVKKTVGLLN
jgi:hypothetical protein